MECRILCPWISRNIGKQNKTRSFWVFKMAYLPMPSCFPSFIFLILAWVFLCFPHKHWLWNCSCFHQQGKRGKWRFIGTRRPSVCQTAGKLRRNVFLTWSENRSYSQNTEEKSQITVFRLWHSIRRLQGKIIAKLALWFVQNSTTKLDSTTRNNSQLPAWFCRTRPWTFAANQTDNQRNRCGKCNCLQQENPVKGLT